MEGLYLCKNGGNPDLECYSQLASTMQHVRGNQYVDQPKLFESEWAVRKASTGQHMG